MLRGFADLPGRQVHFRQAGSGGAPLLMLHGSPGSSRQLDRLGDALAGKLRVVASDRPGTGDSPKLPMEQPEIADYARAEWALMDGFGFDAVDVYGTHTGAFVAMEMALQAPGRVRRLVLDGIALFSDEQRAAFLVHYAPPMRPDRAGTHLPWAFQFCRDLMLFFPWFEPRRENARGLGLPTADVLHGLVLDLLKSLETYHLAYHASFRYPARAQLPLLRQPVLAIAAEDDPLLGTLNEAVALMEHAVTRPVGSVRTAEGVASLAAAIADFLQD